MPIYMRLPKRGFTNLCQGLQLRSIWPRSAGAVDAGKLDASETVTVEALKAAGVVSSRPRRRAPVLAKGELNRWSREPPSKCRCLQGAGRKRRSKKQAAR
jgi:large subunit ribosomal protein L15